MSGAKFKVGDRVKAVGYGNTGKAVAEAVIKTKSGKGTVVNAGYELDGDDDEFPVKVRLDEVPMLNNGDQDVWYYPSQLRKLKKKPALRRIWVPDCSVDVAISKGSTSPHVCISSHRVIPQDIEFVEVRKKAA